MSLPLLTPEPLTRAAFAPFGDVLESLGRPGRLSPAATVGGSRPNGIPTLGITRIAAHTGDLTVSRIERHAHSSQSFIPMQCSAVIVVVAPPSALPPSSPDQFRVFIGGRGQGVNYAAAVWHHPLIVLNDDAEFSTLIWRAHDGEDEEFYDLPCPFGILAIHAPAVSGRA